MLCKLTIVSSHPMVGSHPYFCNPSNISLRHFTSNFGEKMKETWTDQDVEVMLALIFFIICIVLASIVCFICICCRISNYPENSENLQLNAILRQSKNEASRQGNVSAKFSRRNTTVQLVPNTLSQLSLIRYMSDETQV